MMRSSRKNRRAYLLAETSVAALLLGLALVGTVKMLGWTAAERRSSERRGWAVQEAANVMETLTAIPFDRLSQAAAREAATLSEDAGGVLPEGHLDVQIVEEPPLKRIDLALVWRGASGLNEAPVRLTAWVARKGAKP